MKQTDAFESSSIICSRYSQSFVEGGQDFKIKLLSMDLLLSFEWPSVILPSSHVLYLYQCLQLSVAASHIVVSIQCHVRHFRIAFALVSVAGLRTACCAHAAACCAHASDTAVTVHTMISVCIRDRMINYVYCTTYIFPRNIFPRIVWFHFISTGYTCMLGHDCECLLHCHRFTCVAQTVQDKQFYIFFHRAKLSVEKTYQNTLAPKVSPSGQFSRKLARHGVSYYKHFHWSCKFLPILKNWSYWLKKFTETLSARTLFPQWTHYSQNK